MRINFRFIASQTNLPDATIDADYRLVQAVCSITLHNMIQKLSKQLTPPIEYNNCCSNLTLNVSYKNSVNIFQAGNSWFDVLKKQISDRWQAQLSVLH